MHFINFKRFLIILFVKDDNIPRKKNTAKASRFTNREKVALIGLIALILLVVFILNLSDTKETKPVTEYKAQKDEPQFVKEGTLFFLDEETSDTIKTIAIEVADNNQERAQGLMFRSAMADSLGMLFVFDRAEEQSFWMKNTKMTLDILYVDEDGKIVTLYKYATPYSESPILSYEKAKYVVEVSGGFTDRYKIQKGDLINFIRSDL